ncbi:uncharacterized protein [Magallana gigas]|uniref:uncharacterized protein n=1 Tax=Magallana gigas TaxID=29159 RepID=UPI0033414064
MTHQIILAYAKKGQELACSVNDKLLQHHFGYLFTELEPREIADEMFQAGHFSTSDHDYLADLPNRHKRLKSVLKFLERKHLHAPFLDVLKSLHHASVIATLQTERQFIPKPSTGTALSIQHNFTVLLEELPDQAIHIMKHVLTHSDRSDIKQVKSVFRKKAKLLKIVLRNRDYACKELFNTISLYFRRDDLIQAMETKSARMLGRGRPVLNPSLSLLSTSCLGESSDLFEDELEPIRVSDLLFEERAVDILDHDIITRIVSRREQIKMLLDTLKRNKEDCFHFFLYILQNDFENICNALNKPTFAAPRVSMFDGPRSLTYEVARAQGDVQNKDIKVHLSLSGRAGSQIERELIHRIGSDVPDFLEEIIAHGQMDVLYVTADPVVLQLRPLTDDAVHTLLNAKENKRLLNMIFGILKTAITVQQFDTEKSCQIRVQVYYANSGPSNLKSGISRTIQIKDLLRVHRNKLQFELEPTQVISALSKSKAIQKGSIHCASSSCTEKINGILSMVKDGSTDLVESFVAALKDLGYRDIVELIDPTDVHTKAEDIRKSITSNYKNILDEMQITLANETLAKCIGYVHDVKNKLSQKKSSRHQRMNAFLRFIVKDDHNVIEFARVLENNGLEKLLRCKHDVHGENIPVQDIEMMVVDDYSPPSRDGVLLDSLITLAYGDKAEHIGPWAENIESGDLRQLFGSFCIKIPEDPDGLSFTKDILGESKLAEFVEEIRYLARNVVLYKYLRDEEKKPGTVYVYEVNVKYTANQVVIDDEDARQKFDFFQRKNRNLVKVILIKGGFHSILQAKKKAYQKYKQYFNFERFHLHHESEEYTEVAKLSAHRKVVSYKEFVESVRDSIPLQNIDKIVKDAVNRALSKESITELCYDVVIQESGNTNSDSYYCRSPSTVNKLKEELMRKTVDSVSKYLGSEICNEIQRHIQTELHSKLSIDTDSIYEVLNFSTVLFLEAMVTAIGYMLNPVLGVLFGLLSVVGTFLFAVNVNSRSWRRDVANGIYKQMDKNKEKVVTELSSNIKTRCKITADHLKLIADLLEKFTSRIHLNDQDTRLWEES